MSSSDRPTRWLRRLAWASLAVLVLGLTFRAYLRPDFLVALANDIWACF